MVFKDVRRGMRLSATNSAGHVTHFLFFIKTVRKDYIIVDEYYIFEDALGVAVDYSKKVDEKSWNDKGLVYRDAAPIDLDIMKKFIRAAFTMQMQKD